MSTSRRDSTLDEQKYPEEGMHRGFDKDDVKQQHHEHQFGAKAHHLIEKLKHKFEHTDYSQGTPAERLEHMSLDANKIVAAREKAAKEAQQAADAPFWEAEHKRLADLQNAPKSPKQKVNVSGTAPGPTAGRIMRGDVASSRGEFPSETQTDTKRAVPDRDDGVTQTISHTKQSQTLESGEGIVPRGLTLDEQKARGQPANQRVWQSGGDGDSSLAKSASPDSNATGGVSSHIRSGDSSSFSSFPGWRASKDSSSYWSKGSSQLDDKSTMAGSDSIPSVPSSSTSKDSNNLQAAQQRLVLPTYLPPDQRKQQSQGILSRTKESIEDTLDLAKDKIEHGLEATRDNIEHGLEATKDTLEGGMAATREKVLEWKDDAEHALSSTKHTIVDKSNELTASIKEKASDMKEAITHKSHDLKENIDLKADQAKLKGREMVDDVKMKTRELKDDASSKAENLKDSIELKGDQVKLKGREWKSEVSSKSRDLKDDASLKTEQMKLKGREWQNDLAAKSRDLKDDAAIKSHNLKDSLELKGEQAKLKGRELSSDIKEGARDLKSNIENGASRLKDTALHAAEDVEDDAKSLYQRAKTSWWNPLSHLPSSGEVKEKASDVKDRAASKIDSATSPSSSVRISTGVTVNPVPLSLRGLEDSEELPKPQMPKKLRGLPTTQNLDAVHVPNSLRGLEDRSEVPPPAPGAHQHQQHGLVHRLFHMFDRDSGSLASHGGSLPSHSDIIAPSATRREKLDASVRDFWDFRAQDDIDARARAASAASTSAAPTSLRGLESDMRGLRSPVPSVPSVPSTSHRGIELPSASDLHVSPTHFGARSPQFGSARRQTWDILHDRQFEELLAETME